MTQTIDDAYVAGLWRSRFLLGIAHPVSEHIVAGYVIEEYASLEDALLVLNIYFKHHINAEIISGRYLCICTCPIYN